MKVDLDNFPDDILAKIADGEKFYVLLEKICRELKAARLMREGLEYAYHGCTDRLTCEVCRVLKKYDEATK